MVRWNVETKKPHLKFRDGVSIKYWCPQEINYFSERYGKGVTVSRGYPSDGATGAKDINSTGWWVHDVLCDRGTWDDGSKVTNWQASMVLRDILWKEGYYFRAHRWLVATWLLGGGKARVNGMF